MPIGRTSNAIKIKTDSPGLRAVECACCQSGPFDPCEDCPHVFANYSPTMLWSGGSVSEDFAFAGYGSEGQLCSFSYGGSVAYTAQGPVAYTAQGPDSITTGGQTDPANFSIPFDFLAADCFFGRERENEVCGWLLWFSLIGSSYSPWSAQIGGGDSVFIAGNNPSGTYTAPITITYASYGEEGTPSPLSREIGTVTLIIS